MGTTTPACRIILAEDNPADVRLVRYALQEHHVDCELRVMSDGDEVLSFIKDLDRNTASPCPDLLLLDLHLPKRGGHEILKFVRSSERCGQTHVVIMTSSDSPADQRMAEMHAAVQYFRKPSSLDQFLSLGKIVKEALTGTGSKQA